MPHSRAFRCNREDDRETEPRLPRSWGQGEQGMIAAFIAAALTTTQPVPMVQRAGAQRAPSCLATPSLCLTHAASRGAVSEFDDPARRPDAKMDAYRFDAKPCRLIGNMDCPRRANRKLFRAGEPIGQTIARSFGLR